MLADEDRFRIFTGNANPDLAREIAAYLGTTVGDAVINRFNNGEIQVMINESVRGKDIFIVRLCIRLYGIAQRMLHLHPEDTVLLQ